MEISVLLVVRNCEKYIKECLDSILAQTYTDFELLIVDDASTDNTVPLIEGYTDKRIRLVCMLENDYIRSLNWGLEHAEGEYIARMDGDDIMLPHRLEKQVELMNGNPDVAACSSWYECFGSRNNIIREDIGKVKNPLLALMKGNIMAHSATMIRKSFLEEKNIRYREYLYAEDYKLWSDIAMAGGVLYVIPEVLLKYRCSPEQVSFIKREEQANTAFLIKTEILEFLLEAYSEEDENLMPLYDMLATYNEKNELSSEMIFHLFMEIFRLKNLSVLSK